MGERFRSLGLWSVPWDQCFSVPTTAYDSTWEFATSTDSQTLTYTHWIRNLGLGLAICVVTISLLNSGTFSDLGVTSR